MVQAIRKCCDGMACTTTQGRSGLSDLTGGLESGAAADRGDDEVQWGMAGMATLFDEVFRGLMGSADLDEFWLLVRLVLAKVDTQATLSVVNVKHDSLPSDAG